MRLATRSPTHLPLLSFSHPLCRRIQGHRQAFVPMQLLGVSVLTFKAGPKGLVRKMSHPVEAATPWLALWLPMLATWTPIHTFATTVVLSFFLLPSQYAAAFWVGSLTVYYLLTGFGAPEHTGKAWQYHLCAGVSSAGFTFFC